MLCSSLSLQMWQPYMISLFQHTLGIANYVIPIALIVVFSATLSVLGGKLMDKYGKTRIYYPVAIVGIVGGLLCYLIKFFHPDNEILKMVSLVLGGTLIMCGNMLCSGLFIATARDYTPKGKTGSFQGIRMVLVIMTPMVIGSLLCPFIIKWFGTEPTAQMIADGVYQAGDKVYPYELFLFSAIIAAFVFIPSVICRRKEKAFRLQKLRELHLVSPGETPEENTSN
jgi:MFS family permease